VYGIQPNSEGSDWMDFWQFRVGRQDSVIALNVLAGARKMQVSSNLIIVTLFLQRCDFAHLPIVRLACGNE